MPFSSYSYLYFFLLYSLPGTTNTRPATGIEAPKSLGRLVHVNIALPAYEVRHTTPQHTTPPIGTNTPLGGKEDTWRHSG